VPDTTDARPEGPTPCGRILLAEDNLINQRVGVAMLAHLGFEVDVVADGPAAVDAALHTGYQAILMDCQIPGLDGFRATGEIRRREEPGRRTPIIAVTSSATESAGQRCLAAGMDDHLAKPLRLKTLTAALDRWVPAARWVRRVDGPAEPDPPSRRGAPYASDAGRGVLDAHVVARLERLGAAAGEDLLGQLVTLFLADADTLISALRLAIAVGDAAAVVRSAHTLSGSSANLGATDLAGLCAGLAAQPRAAEPVGRAELLAQIEAELGRVRAALGLLVPAA
jgi:two-component system, sensor histidine kinase and response regulator